MSEADDPYEVVSFLSTGQATQPLASVNLLPPIDQQEVWAAGVTYKRSRTARMEESASSADCYDRVSGFIDSMFRQCERKETTDVLLVTHGLTIRCFVMRFLHLDVSDFEKMANPVNASVITVARNLDDAEPAFSRGKWKVSNLHARSE